MPLCIHDLTHRFEPVKTETTTPIQPLLSSLPSSAEPISGKAGYAREPGGRPPRISEKALSTINLLSQSNPVRATQKNTEASPSPSSITHKPKNPFLLQLLPLHLQSKKRHTKPNLLPKQLSRPSLQTRTKGEKKEEELRAIVVFHRLSDRPRYKKQKSFRLIKDLDYSPVSQGDLKKEVGYMKLMKRG